MTNEEILREINSLPADAQRQIEDFFTFLRQRYKNSSPYETATNSNLATEEFIGMWRDREDLQDRTAWLGLSIQGLEAAYGDEPEYSLVRLKEANPKYDETSL